MKQTSVRSFVRVQRFGWRVLNKSTATQTASMLQLLSPMHRPLMCINKAGGVCDVCVRVFFVCLFVFFWGRGQRDTTKLFLTRHNDVDAWAFENKQSESCYRK